MQEESSRLQKEERVTNDFLKMLSESSPKYEINDLERIADSYERNFQNDF
jgi:hypothetical protein